MANLLFSLIKGIGSFILGSLRLILFFVCLIMALVNLVSLGIVMSSNFSTELFPHFGVGQHYYLYVAMTFGWLLALSLLGCYGAFYKHKPSIKLFALMACLTACVETGKLFYAMENDASDTGFKNFMKDLKRQQGQYDWFSNYDTKNNVTALWDIIQSTTLCCGYDDASDWSQYRPSVLGNNKYPKSCCPGRVRLGSYCTPDDELYKVGCSTRIKEFKYIIVMVEALYIGFMIALSLTGCIISHLNFEGSRRPTVQQIPVARASSYQAGLIRQPAYNEAYKPASGSKVPLMYPPAPNFGDMPPSYQAKA